MNDLHQSFFGSLKWAFYMTWGDRAFSVFFTFLLAAILGPRDFGVVAARAHLHLRRAAHPRGRDPDRGRAAPEPRGRPPRLGVLGQPGVVPRARGGELSPRRLVGAAQRRPRARERGQGPVVAAPDLGAHHRPACDLPAGDALPRPRRARNGCGAGRGRARARARPAGRGGLGAGRAAARLRRDTARPSLGHEHLEAALPLLALARPGARRLLEWCLPRPTSAASSTAVRTPS